MPDAGVDDGFVMEAEVRAKFFLDKKGNECVELAPIGDPRTLGTVIHRVSQRPDLVKAFPLEYEAHRQGLDPSQIKMSGLPLEDLVPPQMADKLRAVGIRTVEHLANLSDSGLGALGMGAVSLRERAKEMVMPKQGAVEAVIPAMPAGGDAITEVHDRIDKLAGVVENLAHALANSQVQPKQARKPRSDKGKSRKKTPADQTAAMANDNPDVVPHPDASKE
ncbi:MAG: hypothetical protein ACR2PW_04505 [Gammaproteobacteria bacterium]